VCRPLAVLALPPRARGRAAPGDSMQGWADPSDGSHTAHAPGERSRGTRRKKCVKNPLCSDPLDEGLRVTRAGVTYVKVHSVPRFSGGESCGQIKDEDEDQWLNAQGLARVSGETRSCRKTLGTPSAAVSRCS
jgi:hypothetical protein